MSGFNNESKIADRKQNQEKRRQWKHWQKIAFYLVLYDIVAVNFSYFFALLLRFDLSYTRIPGEYLSAFLRFAPFYTVFSLILFCLLRLYSSLWRFASISELNRIAVASVVTAIFHSAGITIFFRRMPYSYYIIGCVTQFIMLILVRFGYRYITLERARRTKQTASASNAMVIGAGAAGQVILKELRSSSEAKAKACCVIDDNPNKWGRDMMGVPIVGGRESILEAAEKYKIDLILFAIPTATAAERREILNICKETKCELKSLPGVYQLANGQVS